MDAVKKSYDIPKFKEQYENFIGGEWRDSAARHSLLDYLRWTFEAHPSLVPDLVFCTGDIAYGHAVDARLADQYKQAAEFFQKPPKRIPKRKAK